MTKPRKIRVSAAQLGPIPESESRESVVRRLVALAEEAADVRAQLVVFPELALTPYFPKVIRDDFDQFFETAMPNPSVQPLFDTAKRAGLAFCLGYAELTDEGRHYNTTIYVDADGEIRNKYRKIHLPGLPSTAPEGKVRVYEPHFFNHGDLGFQTFQGDHATMGISICQDRRYPETFRALGLAGAEIVVNGYNTPADPLALSQNELALRAGAYQNSLFVVAAAHCGVEDGVHLIAGSCIIDPHGQVIARASSEDDELITATLDMAQVDAAHERWNFYGRRHPSEYSSLTAPVTAPKILSTRD